MSKKESIIIVVVISIMTIIAYAFIIESSNKKYIEKLQKEKLELEIKLLKYKL